jgi:hypothetical protein
VLTVAPVADEQRVEDFKQRTQAKLDGVVCPHHHKAPRLRFHGRSLRELTNHHSGCCDALIEMANKAIAIH